MKTLLAIIAVVSLSVHTGLAAGDTDVQEAIAAAKAAQKKADSLQGGWVTTDDLIKQAEEASAEGQKDTALKLARKAQKEAELAYAQAEHERKHWSPPPYLLPK
jgi:pyruvoyl-dependent arginine decarboxylase (PvlArgDC)